MDWKKGRGRLGIFEPLMGTWEAEAETARGPIRCTRIFNKILAGKYLELRADWQINDSHYEELCLIGIDRDRSIGFWSFTSDGKRSTGRLADVSDLDPRAIGFEAQMEAGLARQAYWPDPENGFHWVVESSTKKGWNRFVHHHYRSAT
jgi:hypothetical protein